MDLIGLARKLRPMIEQAAQSLSDSAALQGITLYPRWTAGAVYPGNFKARHNGRLWRCLQAHTAQTGWEPENTPALWEEICETHAGTLADPIPYDGNMALTAGLYYIQDAVVYLCTRDTVSPVYNPLAELVGIYVEVHT